MANVDVSALNALVAARYVTCHRHPEAPLLIWNYAARTQYERHWTPETLMARGLITTPDGKIVARPFQKFFGLDDLRNVGIDVPNEPFEVYDKLDGSLGILHWIDDQLRIATRGSFVGEQAIEGTRIFQRYRDRPWRRDLTYLFEILYPANRIVVDYGDREDTVLLAATDPETGWDVPGEVERLAATGVPVVRRYDGITAIDELTSLAADNAEGFVIRFQSGLRAKVKFAEYLRLHRLICGVNERHIWECLRDNTPLESLLDRVPDEFGAWVRDRISTLRERYEAINTQCIMDFAGRPEGDRKTAALYFTGCAYPPILFAMLDSKPHDHIIWKLIRPEASAPYKVDEV